MNDLISRQAAIDKINELQRKLIYCFGFENDAVKTMDIAKSIIAPPAQPPVLTCDGCKHVGTYDTDFPCSGCIRREKDYYEQER